MLEPKFPHKEPVDVPCGIDGDVQPCVVEQAVVITLICQRTVGASLVVDRFLWVREGLERLNGSPIIPWPRMSLILQRWRRWRWGGGSAVPVKASLGSPLVHLQPKENTKNGKVLAHGREYVDVD